MSEHTPRLGSRELFPTLEWKAYVNHAAMSPWSVPVREAMRNCMEDYAARGLGAFFVWHEQRQRLKGRLATLIGADAGEIAYVPSTTRGLVDLALCLPWRPGDRVILFEGEFPTNVTPWQRAAALHDLEIVMLSATSFREDEPGALEGLGAELEKGARLVAVSAVEFQTGYRMPLEAIGALCREAGAELCVDAIQALGVVPLDVRAIGVDYLVCGAHKWLMSADGIAFVYAPLERSRALRPHVAGWLSHESPVSFLLEGAGHLRYDRPFRESIDVLEGGSASTIGCAALEASVDLLQTLGVADIFRHVSEYLNALEPRLVDMGLASLRSPVEARRSGILSVVPPSGISVVALQKSLAERGVFCTTPDGCLRFSPHWPNPLDEVDVVAEAVAASLHAAREA